MSRAAWAPHTWAKEFAGHEALSLIGNHHASTKSATNICAVLLDRCPMERACGRAKCGKDVSCTENAITSDGGCPSSPFSPASQVISFSYQRIQGRWHHVYGYQNLSNISTSEQNWRILIQQGKIRIGGNADFR